MVSNLYMVFCGMDPLFYFFKLFIYFWLCCIFTAARGFFKLRLGGGYSLGTMSRLLIAVASLVAKHRLQGMQVSVAVIHVLRSCDSQTLEHRLNNCSEQT